MTIGLLLGCRLGSEPGGGGLCGLVWVCACRNATLLEVTCHGSRFYYPILLYICALEIFAVKTTSLSKVLLLFFAFFVFRAPTCQQDVINSAALFSSLDSLREEFILPFECYLLLELLAFTLVY